MSSEQVYTLVQLATASCLAMVNSPPVLQSETLDKPQMSEGRSTTPEIAYLCRAGLPGNFQKVCCPRQENGHDCGVYVLGERLAC